MLVRGQLKMERERGGGQLGGFSRLGQLNVDARGIAMGCVFIVRKKRDTNVHIK